MIDKIAKLLFYLSYYYKWKDEDEIDLFRSRLVFIVFIVFTICTFLFILFNINIFKIINCFSQIRVIRLIYLLLLLAPFYFTLHYFIPDKYILKYKETNENEAKNTSKKIVYTIVLLMCINFILLYLKASSKI